MTERLKKIHEAVDELLEKVPEKGQQKKYMIHTYTVANYCALLAERRGLNPELSAVIGMLHDVYAIDRGTYEAHDVKGAEMARVIMGNTKEFSADEIDIAANAILRHDGLDKIDEPMTKY